MFSNDFKKSRKFSRELLPLVQNKLKADRLVSFEDLEDQQIPSLFDQYAGVDAVGVYKNGLRGIALRNQYDKAWNTFTIRASRVSGAKTEYEKRVEAINNNYIYPYLTCQCYCDNQTRELLSGGICRTCDLFEFIQNNLEMIKNRKLPCPEGNWFYWVTFTEIKEIYPFIAL